MDKAVSGKRVLVVSDNEGVARVITLALGQTALTTTRPLYSKKSVNGRLPSEDWALVILGLSSFVTEPVMAYARTMLTDYIGRMPLLIISERPCLSDVSTRTWHMDFPFTLGELQNLVHQILRIEADDAPDEPCVSEAQLGMSHDEFQ